MVNRRRLHTSTPNPSQRHRRENVFFGEHKAAQERAVADRELAEQEAKTQRHAAAQNAIEDDETLEEERAA